MNTQPEALRLADELEKLSRYFVIPFSASDELRRLYEINQMLISALETAIDTTYSDYLESEWKLLLAKAKEQV